MVALAFLFLTSATDCIAQDARKEAFYQKSSEVAVPSSHLENVVISGFIEKFSNVEMSGEARSIACKQVRDDFKLAISEIKGSAKTDKELKGVIDFMIASKRDTIYYTSTIRFVENGMLSSIETKLEIPKQAKSFNDFTKSADYSTVKAY